MDETKSQPVLRSHKNAIYCVYDGRARYVPSTEIMNDHSYLGEIREIDNEDLSRLKWGPNLPRVKFAEVTDFNTFREYLCTNLYGSGIEFGAGPRPIAVPADCKIKYADIFTKDQFLENSSAARGMGDSAKYVDIDLIDSMDIMVSIPHNSIDFIIASHVIEHVRSPLTVMKNALERLRKGGTLVLVVPDRDRTFDRDRPVTSLDHMLSDYFLPSAERDFEHYVEVCRFIENIAFDKLQNAATRKWQQKSDTHLHTFTPHSLEKVAEWACGNLGYSSFELHDGYLNEPSNEFYLKLFA